MVRPPLPWREGRVLVPAPWQTSDPEWRFPLVTLAEPGQIGLLNHPGWHLSIRTPGPLESDPCDVTAHGFRLPVNGHRPVHGWLAASGILVIEAPPGTRVELQGLPQQPEDNANAFIVDRPDHAVGLSVRNREDGTLQAVLAARSADHAHVLAAMQAAHNHVPSDQWVASQQPLTAFWSVQSPVRPAANLALAHAVDELSGYLRPAADALSFWWSLSPGGDGLGQVTDDLYPLARAWSSLYPPMASALVKTVLSAQQEDGALPRMVRPDGFHDTRWAPLPLVARSAWLAWQAQPDREFHDYVMPRLHRYLQWTIAYFDPEWRGLPIWRDAREAWTSETYNPLVATADLPAMLASELDALRDLSRAVPAGSLPQEDFLRYRASLGRTLAGFFWNQQATMFQDRFPAGDHVIRLTLSATLPLLDTTLARDTLHPVAERLDRGGSLRDTRGAREWSMWPDDPEPPPVHEDHQLLVLDALEGAGETNVAAGLRQDLAMRHCADEPRRLTPPEAALRVVTLGRPGRTSQPFAMISPLLTWLDQHRTSVLGSLLVAMLLLLAVIISVFLFKPVATAQTAQTSLGLSRRLYQEGRYQEALDLLLDIRDSGRTFPYLYLHIGNARYQLGQWEEAEAAYRQELQRDVNVVAAQLNLGLALLRQHRKQEALGVYGSITNRFAQADPLMANRAARAIQLLSENPLALPDLPARQEKE